jgi:hypothetical protein
MATVECQDVGEQVEEGSCSVKTLEELFFFLVPVAYTYIHG